MVDMLTELTTTLDQALVQPFINVVPWLIVAAIIIVVFWLVSKVIKRAVVQILQSIGVDTWVEEHKITPAIGNRKISDVFGSLSKWYFIWVGFYIAAGYVRLEGLADFLGALVYYVPKALAGVLFFVLALLFARYVSNQILGLQHKLKNAAAFAVEAIIIVFAAVISLQMIFGLEVGQTIIQLLQIFVQPFIIALAIVFGIVGGLAAGLAFKEDLGKFAKDIKKEYLQ